MIGLDTNVLVRFLARDDAGQARRAEALLRGQCSAEDPGWIGVIVLCETLWVLGRGYGYDRDQLVTVVEHLLRAPFLAIEDAVLVHEALDQWRAGELDFTDALVAVRNRHAGCATTFTFDRRAAREPGFSRVP